MLIDFFAFFSVNYSLDSLAFFRSDCLIDEVLLLFRTHGPIIINIVNDFGRNLNNRILFFRVELFECLGLVEDGHLGWGFRLAVLVLLVLVLVA